MEHLNKLLADIREIGYRTYDATIFDMIGNGEKETVHSAMIGFLINPNAHEAGAYCLEKLLEKLAADKLAADKLAAFNQEAVSKVVLEYDLGPVVINEHPTGGRIDVYLEDASGCVLVIENKIYASDQKCQLLRYHNTLDDRNQPHILVYLTLFGNSPSGYSLGTDNQEVKSTLSSDDVITLSYGQINDWLAAIKDRCSPSISYNIEQYQDLINKLIMKETVINTILTSGDNYLSAVKIAENIENCRMELKRRFMQDLRQELSSDYETKDISHGKLVGIEIELEPNLTIKVLIDWRLYVSCEKPEHFGVKLNHGTWDYIGSNDDYNFHDGTSKVKEYLSAGKEGNPVIKEVATILKSKFQNNNR